MLKKNLFLSWMLITSMLSAASASAQVYVGGTVGQSNWSSDCNKAGVQCDKSSSAYKIFAAYELDKNLAIEASLFSLGSLKANAKLANAQAYTEAKATGFELAGVLQQNFTEDLSAFAKVGLTRVSVETNANAPFIFFKSADTTSTQPVAGLGLMYKISKDIALRGEFELRQTKLGDEKNTVNNFSVGVQYRF